MPECKNCGKEAFGEFVAIKGKGILPKPIWLCLQCLLEETAKEDKDTEYPQGG